MNVYIFKSTAASSPKRQNLLQRVVQFFHPKSSCTTHISADVPVSEMTHTVSSGTLNSTIPYHRQRFRVNALCMTISGGRTKRLYIFCRVTGFTSDFLSFIVVKLIQSFHGALQLSSF